MAAKKTDQLLPFCHQIPLDSVKIEIEFSNEHTVDILSTVKTHHKTGVEMEAIVASSMAAITIYDMTKAISHDINIAETTLLRKTGGKSDLGPSSSD